MEISQDMFIDGQRIPSQSGRRFDSVNPATNQVVASLPEADANDVDRAVQAASAALQGEWKWFSQAQRQTVITKLAQLIRENRDELARLDTLEMGMPITRSQMSVDAVARFFDWYASAARMVGGDTIANLSPRERVSMTVREPVGVVGAIIPWNAPASMVAWKLGPVLATGCTLVLKPAESASTSALRIAELCQEAGVPDGVVNVVTGLGEAGASLSSNPGIAKLAFTGSVATGKAIMRAAAENVTRTTMELGGKSPNIIFADADLDAAAKAASGVIFGNSGQVCTAGSRLLVQASIQDEFVEKVVECAKALRVGDPLDAETEMGPVANEQQLDRVMSYIETGESEGGVLVAGGKRIAREGLNEGFFIEPTVFKDVTDQMTINREEIFGPVLSVMPFEDEAEAIEKANGTSYGLAAYLWTGDVGRAFRVSGELKCGTVHVNSISNLDPAVPVGGRGISGYGKELGVDQLDAYLETKAIWFAK